MFFVLSEIGLLHEQTSVNIHIYLQSFTNRKERTQRYIFPTPKMRKESTSSENSTGELESLIHGNRLSKSTLDSALEDYSISCGLFQVLMICYSHMEISCNACSLL